MSSYGGLALSGETLYLADADGSVWALDARSGASLWQQEGLAYRWLSTPAVAGDYVVVGDFEGYVHVLSTEDGSIAARTRVGDDPIRAAPLAVGNTVYIANSDGTLGAIRRAEVRRHPPVERKDRGRGAQLGAHVADGALARRADRLRAGPQVLDHLVGPALHGQGATKIRDHVLRRGPPVQLPAEPDAHERGDEQAGELRGARRRARRCQIRPG